MKKRYRIEIYPDKSRKYRFRIKHKNGLIVADGAQGYTRKPNCRHNAENLKLSLQDSEIIELKKEK